MNPKQVLPPHSQKSSYCGSPGSCEWSSEIPSLPLATWSNRYTVGCGHNHWASWGRWWCRHCQWMYHHTQGHLQQSIQHNGNIRSTDSERRGLHWFESGTETVHDSLNKFSHWAVIDGAKYPGICFHLIYKYGQELNLDFYFFYNSSLCNCRVTVLYVAHKEEESIILRVMLKSS